MQLDSKITTEGPLFRKVEKYKSTVALVAPNNKRRIEVIVWVPDWRLRRLPLWGELGYKVKAFTFHDSPRRAHSIAAQGASMQPKLSKWWWQCLPSILWYHQRWRLQSQRSQCLQTGRDTQIIDQCVAQGVPFAREYGGLLENRSFGGVQVSREHFMPKRSNRPTTVNRSLSGIIETTSTGAVKMYNRHEMMDLVVIDGKARAS